MRERLEITPSDIIDFWYTDAIKSQWFNATPQLDQEIRRRFEGIWQRAAAGGLDHWGESSAGSLALAIILDQFPLNMFRGGPASFSTEAKAIVVTLTALTRGLDKRLERQRRAFLYMPLMHSENMMHQELSVELFTQAGLDENAVFAKHHRDIIRRFGRFPHRNAILGRHSTAEEIAYLASDQAFKG